MTVICNPKYVPFYGHNFEREQCQECVAEMYYLCQFLCLERFHVKHIQSWKCLTYVVLLYGIYHYFAKY